jgi:hypothetical protein
LSALPAYATALETGWSPNTTREVSGEQLAALRADPEAFLAALNRRGCATESLRLMLPLARLEGLAGIEITCDADNDASRRVIVANGGIFQGTGLEGSDPPARNGMPRRRPLRGCPGSPSCSPRWGTPASPSSCGSRGWRRRTARG